MATQNKLTEKAQEAIVAAQELAEARNNTQLEPEHLLYAFVTQEGGVVPALLQKLGVQPSAVMQRLQPLWTDWRAQAVQRKCGCRSTSGVCGTRRAKRPIA